MVVWGLVALKAFWFSLFFSRQGCLDGCVSWAPLVYSMCCTVLCGAAVKGLWLWNIVDTATLASSHLSAHPPIYPVGYGISHMMNMCQLRPPSGTVLAK